MMAFTRTSVGDFVIVMIVMLSLIRKCINGEYDGVGRGAPMVKTEREALYSAIQG